MDSQIPRISTFGETEAFWRRKRKDLWLGPCQDTKKRSSGNQVNKASSNQWKVTRKLQLIEDVNHPYWLCKSNSNLKDLWLIANRKGSPHGFILSFLQQCKTIELNWVKQFNWDRSCFCSQNTQNAALIGPEHTPSRDLGGKKLLFFSVWLIQCHL